MTSPWRKEHRQLRGILHGFYVFYCVSEFFKILNLSNVLDAEGTSHAVGRRAQIGDEFSQVDFDQLARGMTNKGQMFLKAVVDERQVGWPDWIANCQF
jgi:HEXXH motif-containing protein